MGWGRRWGAGRSNEESTGKKPQPREEQCRIQNSKRGEKKAKDNPVGPILTNSSNSTELCEMLNLTGRGGSRKPWCIFLILGTGRKARASHPPLTAR